MCVENWDVKGKFPPGLKPLLSQVALKAITLNEYDDNFFNLMPKIFPYNRFTMSVSPLVSSLLPFLPPSFLFLFAFFAIDSLQTSFFRLHVHPL